MRVTRPGASSAPQEHDSWHARPLVTLVSVGVAGFLLLVFVALAALGPSGPTRRGPSEQSLPLMDVPSPMPPVTALPDGDGKRRPAGPVDSSPQVPFVTRALGVGPGLPPGASAAGGPAVRAAGGAGDARVSFARPAAGSAVLPGAAAGTPVVVGNGVFLIAPGAGAPVRQPGQEPSAAQGRPDNSGRAETGGPGRAPAAGRDAGEVNERAAQAAQRRAERARRDAADTRRDAARAVERRQQRADVERDDEPRQRQHQRRHQWHGGEVRTEQRTQARAERRSDGDSTRLSRGDREVTSEKAAAKAAKAKAKASKAKAKAAKAKAAKAKAKAAKKAGRRD